MASTITLADSPINLRSVFRPDSVEVIQPDTPKPAVIRQLVGSLARAGQLAEEHVQEIAATLVRRERSGSTALGKGLAFPHLRSRIVANFAGAIGVAQGGIDFESLDGQPTRLILLLLSPFEARQQHCQIMGRLATLLSDKTLQYSVQIPRATEALFRFLGMQ